jgi:predicted patatin/cPLA2 family phospholipase
MNAATYKSRQIGRAMRIMLAYRDDPRCMSWWSYVKTGNIAAEDFLYDKVQNELDPFDNETFKDNPMRMYCVASDAIFGTPAYLEVKELPEDIEAIRASSSLPLFSHTVKVRGHEMLDGGTTDSIPFAAALGEKELPYIEGFKPAEKALVVLTRDRGYVKGLGNEGLVLRSHRYDDYPYFIKALEDRRYMYNGEREDLWRREKEGSCLVIAPPEPVDVGVNESDGGKLLDLYIEGRQEAIRRLDEICAFVPESTWQPAHPGRF